MTETTYKMYPEMTCEVFEAITKAIIDSLKVCTALFPSCKKCVYTGEDKSVCQNMLIQDALNIIQRQQIEIENLRNIDKRVVSNLAADIVDMFDEFLEEKGVKIPCADPEEESARYDDNCACLYGMEYWGLVDKVEDVIGMYEVKE